jgi:capsular polysaccharide export protein
VLEGLWENGAPYMLFPLQLDSDAQIRLHSPFAGIADALRMVISSFAENAPAGMRLVVKAHPLDNGVRDWCLETRALAKLHGVSERVDFLDGGDLIAIAKRSEGMVTINSTSGTLALALEVPVIALGHAVYDIDGVTFQGALDDFWHDPGKPDAPTFEAFRRVLIDRCLVPGGFFSEEALAKVIEGVVARFEAGSPLKPAAARRQIVHGQWTELLAGD